MQEYYGADAVVMTAVRCIALLYTYHQFRKLRALGSKYILGESRCSVSRSIRLLVGPLVLTQTSLYLQLGKC